MGSGRGGWVCFVCSENEDNERHKGGRILYSPHFPPTSAHPDGRRDPVLRQYPKSSWIPIVIGMSGVGV